ncbi:MAG: GHKL domain-containing protein, partial [Clostridiales bacterium]|nr:GHKL domain-containing protein [Clostridiales bacterium]
ESLDFLHFPIDFLFADSMVLNLLWMLLCIGGLCRLHVLDLLFWWAFTFLQAELMASLAWQLSFYLFELPSLMNPPVFLFNLAVAQAVGLVMRRAINKVENEITGRDRWIPLCAAVVAVLTFLAGNIDVFNTALWMEALRDLRGTIGWIRTLADLCGVFLLCLILFYVQERRIAQEAAAVSSIVETQYRQYLDYQACNAHIARQCHDLKHQVAALRSSYSSQEREAYLSEMETLIDRYGAQCNTRSPVLDTLLTQKAIYCIQQNIKLTSVADAAHLDVMTVQDICGLFGNLLDNAIESVEQLPDQEQRQIVLEVATENGFLHISVENYCLNPPEMQDGLPVTTKADKAMHGLGVKSVVKIVERYQGTYRFGMEDDWFRCSILIPLQSTDHDKQ